MAKRDTHLTMTGDDLRAARILTLAVKFFGTSHPVPSSTIRLDLYPDLDNESFMRQFLRDRELLANFGVIIREVTSSAADTLWKVDERASYVQGEGISAKDARMLYVLCHDLVYDQAFPYRDELRMALAKISRMYRGTVVPHTDRMPVAQHKLLAQLVACMSERTGAMVTYRDAQGTVSTRTLALLGSFGLRGNTYFVASRVEKDGTLVPDSVRTYRLDRFEKVRTVPGCRYLVPEDFSVGDYERLPFQMGDIRATARFLVPDPAHAQVERAMALQGTTIAQDGATLWEVGYADAWAAATWALAEGLTPVAPDELCDAWRDCIKAAAQADLYDASLAEEPLGPTPTPIKKHAGRTGSVALARQLLALASSLTMEGDVITAQQIAQTMDISYDDARHLIALVSLGSGESIDYLPVILSDEDDEVFLMEGGAAATKRIRLTRSETIALSAALAELGIDEDDPLAQALSRSFAAPAFSVDDIARSLETPGSPADSAVLKQCSQALVDGMALGFSYHPVTGGTPSRRRVLPQQLRRSEDHWYLDAYDLVKRDARVFRVDRMEALEALRAPHDPKPMATKEDRKDVTVRFAGRRCLDLFYWHELQVVSREDDTTTARVPHYGGDWLVRHLAACASDVHIGNEELSQQVKAYAQALLQKI